jgi:hypothetical protein
MIVEIRFEMFIPKTGKLVTRTLLELKEREEEKFETFKEIRGSELWKLETAW